MLAAHLPSKNAVIRVRATGTLHNLSADAIAVRTIRDYDDGAIIHRMIHLLRDAEVEICAASAGTIQNLARDISANKIIAESPNGVQFLIELLFSSDTNCQVRILCAIFKHIFPYDALSQRASIGAIVNIIGPKTESNAAIHEQFKSLLSDAVALGAIQSTIFQGSTR